MTSDQKLQDLTKAFDDRHQWWENIITRAEAMQKQLGDAHRKACVKQQTMEDIARGCNYAAAIAQKSTQTYAGDVAPLYSSKRVLENRVANPLAGIKISGRISRDNPEFWGKFGEHLQNGRYWQASSKLDSGAGNVFKNAWRWLRYSKQDRAEWQDEIARARDGLKVFEGNCEKLAYVRNDIAQGEKAIAGGIHKMLRHKAIQEMLRTPEIQRMATNSPELAFLAQYAANNFKMSKKDIVHDLSDQQGAITNQGIQKAMIQLGRRMGNSVNDSSDAALTALRRLEKAKSFASSARVAHRLETKTSALVDGMYSDLRKSISDSANLGEDERKTLIRTAEIKMRRWTNPAKTEEVIKNLEKKDFDPKEIKSMPWRGYAIYAGLDGIKRSVTEIPFNMLRASVEWTRNLFRQSFDNSASSSSSKGGGRAAHVPPVTPPGQVRPNTRNTAAAPAQGGPKPTPF